MFNLFSRVALMGLLVILVAFAAIPSARADECRRSLFQWACPTVLQATAVAEAPSRKLVKSTVYFGYRLIDQTNDREMLAYIMAKEDGGNGVKAKEAVGKIIMNRRDVQFNGAKTVSQVILAYAQFSPWWEGDDGKKKQLAVELIPQQLALADKVMAHYKSMLPELDGVTHFHAEDMCPDWCMSGEMLRVNHIGGHYFYLAPDQQPNYHQWHWMTENVSVKWPRKLVQATRVALAQTPRPPGAIPMREEPVQVMAYATEPVQQAWVRVPLPVGRPAKVIEAATAVEKARKDVAKPTTVAQNPVPGSFKDRFAPIGGISND